MEAGLRLPGLALMWPARIAALSADERRSCLSASVLPAAETPVAALT